MIATMVDPMPLSVITTCSTAQMTFSFSSRDMNMNMILKQAKMMFRFVRGYDYEKDRMGLQNFLGRWTAAHMLAGHPPSIRVIPKPPFSYPFAFQHGYFFSPAEREFATAPPTKSNE